MGDERDAFVMLDPGELPRSWAAIKSVTEKAVGDAQYRAFPTELVSTVHDTAQSLERTARITLGDDHLDAKLFPHLHPFGTGSLRAEEGSGGIQQYAKQRVLSLDSSFRRSPVWSFWMMERIIKNDLYFNERSRQAHRRGVKRKADGAELPPTSGTEDARPSDNYAMLFGRVDPRHIPESSGWWRSRQTELMAISDEHELGLMTGMITSTQNDNSPLLLAHARRGPCATPTESEMFEFLLTRRAPGEKRANIQDDAAAATVSFQTRTHALKQNFLRRYQRTPIGIVTDYWDRTEAQTRQALHAHILWWSKRKT